LTLAANIAHGRGHGLAGAVVAAWSAAALVGSYELLMMIIRGAQVPRAWRAESACPARPPTASLCRRMPQVFANDLAACRVSSVRAIRAQLHVGQPRAQRVRAHLATLTSG
jgi:hypothetical protein